MKMKKILALVLVLMLSFSCALAEETEVNAYYFDPALVEGASGNFVAVGDLGLQFYLPANFVALEVSETDIARGVLAVLAAEDGSLSMSITVAGVADAEGNLITDLEGLANFYAANGVTEMEIAYFNDVPALFYTLHTPVDYNNLAFVTEEGYFISFSFLPNGTEEMANLANVMLMSVMPVTEEEAAE